MKFAFPWKLEMECVMSNGGSNSRNILVAYASGYGTTAGVAEAIGEVLNQAGDNVDVKHIKKVEQINNYDAIIIGSAIQYDRWMPDARQFVTANQEYLSQIQVAFFFTCMTLSVNNEEARKKANKYSEKIKALSSMVNPVGVGQFAGSVNFDELPFILRQLFRLLSIVTGVKDGDYRDWEAIRSWAQDVYSKIDKLD